MTVGFEVTTANWHEALGPVDGIAQCAEACQRGDWVEAGLQGGTAALETLGDIADPFGALLSAGIGWLIEHFHPLKDWLDDLAGDPDMIEGFAVQWGKVGDGIHHNADDFRAAVAADTAPWSGAAIVAYRGATSVQGKVIDGFGVMTQGVGEAVRVGGALVGMVRGMVRDAISQLVGFGISKVAQFLSVVLAPKAIGELAAKVSEWVGKLTTFVKGLLKSMGKLGDLLADIGHGLSAAGGKIKKLSEAYNDLSMNKGLSIEARAWGKGIKVEAPNIASIVKGGITSVAQTEAARNN